MRKQIEGYEGLYEIDENGLVYNLLTGKTSKGSNFQGYIRNILTKDGKHTKYLNHRLVAIAFIPNPQNYPYINHIDNNRNNNKLENLEWCTPKHNVQHAMRIGVFKPKENKNVKRRNLHGMAKLTENQVSEIRSLYNTKNYTQSLLGALYGTSRSNISFLVNNKRWA